MSGKTLTVYLAADVSKLRNGLNDADRSLGGFSKSLSGMVGPALIGATAAAGAFAVAIGVEGVKAAMAEETELTKLGTTLNNLGFGAQSEKVNKFIDDLQYTAAVTDSELRPAFDRLVRSTGSVEEAQTALQTALDVSVGTGRSLENVAQALARGYDGNTTALGKLGAGLDAATLKSGDMNAINEQLTLTFQGQSEAAAATAAGGMKKLQIATGELIEAFGTGLIGAVGDSAAEIQNAVDQMRALQPAAQNVGSAMGEFGQNAIITADALTEVSDAFGNGNWAAGWKILTSTGDAFTNAVKEARALGKEFEYIQYAAYGAAAATRAVFAFGGAETGGTPTAAYNGLNEMNNAIARMRDRMMETAKATGSGSSGGGGGLSGAIEKMNPKLRAQIDLVKQLTTTVQDAGKALQSARDDMNDWISSMASDILAGIDLGTIQQFDEEGKRTGQSLLDGFQKQIDQAGIFGGYLKQLNSQGGPELRDAVAALGPEAGSKLAKEIIDKGLIQTMQSKLVDVQSRAETTAAEMVPPMLVAGVASAAGYLMEMQNELEAQSSLLEEMGKAMGKTLTEAMVAEIRAVLEAANISYNGSLGVLGGSAGTSAAATAATTITGNPLMNNTAIAQAIAQAIADSNQRLGRTGQTVLQ
jgi:hypothetical protein